MTVGKRGERDSGRRGQRLYRRAKRLIPGGTQLLSKRPEMFLPEEWPAYYDRARGAEVWDLDGHRYADFLNDFSAGLYGHSHPVIRQAMAEALEAGLTLGGHNRYEAKLAALICARFPSIELLALDLASRASRALRENDMDSSSLRFQMAGFCTHRGHTTRGVGERPPRGRPSRHRRSAISVVWQ